MNKLNPYNINFYFNFNIRKSLSFIDKIYRYKLDIQKRKRLKQIFIHHIYYPLMAKTYGLDFIETANFFNQKQIPVSEDFTLLVDERDIKFPFHVNLSKIFEGLFFYAFSIFSLTKGFFFGRFGKNTKFNLTISDFAFQNYYSIQEVNKIVELIEKDYYPKVNESDIVISKSFFFHGIQFGKLIFHKYPVFRLLSLVQWTVDDMIIYLIFSFKFLFRALPKALLKKDELFLFRDNIMILSMHLVDKYSLVNYFFYTNSDCYNQELYTKSRLNTKHSSIMLWYSMNNFDFHFKGNTKCNPFHYAPWMKTMNIDKHLVWNEEQKQLLTILDKDSTIISVHKPILFDNPFREVENSLFNKEKKNIIFFDVPPKNEQIEKLIYGNSFIYANLDTCRRFILDVIETFGSSYNYFIKSKRSKDPGIHPEYLLTIKNNNSIRFLDTDISIFSLFENKIDLVVCFPFTSVAYISHTKNIPTIYYDPISILEEKVLYYNGQILISGKVELKNYFTHYHNSK